MLANSIQLSPEGEVNSGGKCLEDAILAPVAKQLISKDVRYMDVNIRAFSKLNDWSLEQLVLFAVFYGLA